MKKITLLILLSVLYGGTIYSQEQFFKQKGGISTFYGSSISGGEFSNTVGLGLLIKPGITFSVASAKLGEETKPMFNLGLLSQPNEQNSFARGGASITYASSSMITAWGLTGMASKVINFQKKFPTSFDFNLSIINYSYKEQENDLFQPPNQLIPVLNVGISQALYATGSATPVCGIGLNHELKNNITLFSFFLGLNLNFD